MRRYMIAKRETTGMQVTPEIIAAAVQILNEFNPDFDLPEDTAREIFKLLLAPERKSESLNSFCSS
jgi:hypothetical protein